ncbi:serine hydrolase domain-containing protein [Pseudopontixanthobacter vadosimaris]|uniref:serine hydrolase domain-containing protein n=1 Tax=Pseudopontixanthobacter vadosimaris TaxID=2726450 RepID=UPI001473A7C3|nr:serine hydrolase domain-containing protein [Pseudopontixanthobacter vadosimaris]
MPERCQLDFAAAISGEAEPLVRARILDPLGMHDTSITLTPAQKARFAAGRDEYNRPTPAWNLPVLAGAGALRSTAGDMVKFLQAALDPQSPIAPAMRLALAEPRDAPGFRAGLGWMLLPAPTGTILMHGGGTGGFRTYMALQPESQRAIVMLTNSAVEPAVQDIALHLLAGAPLAEAGPVADAPPRVAQGDEVVFIEEGGRIARAMFTQNGNSMPLTKVD